jgi:hypothetical protein
VADNCARDPQLDSVRALPELEQDLIGGVNANQAEAWEL